MQDCFSQITCSSPEFEAQRTFMADLLMQKFMQSTRAIFFLEVFKSVAIWWLCSSPIQPPESLARSTQWIHCNFSFLFSFLFCYFVCFFQNFIAKFWSSATLIGFPERFLPRRGSCHLLNFDDLNIAVHRRQSSFLPLLRSKCRWCHQANWNRASIHCVEIVSDSGCWICEEHLRDVNTDLKISQKARPDGKIFASTTSPRKHSEHQFLNIKCYLRNRTFFSS